MVVQDYVQQIAGEAAPLSYFLESGELPQKRKTTPTKNHKTKTRKKPPQERLCPCVRRKRMWRGARRGLIKVLPFFGKGSEPYNQRGEGRLAVE